MCELCGGYPCRGGCPNEPEPRRVYICPKCREDISEGDEYYDFGGDNKICEECVKVMSNSEILDMTGFYPETAEYIPPYEED